MEIIPAPDFPTAGIIYGVAGVREGYRTGRGRVVMRATHHFEDIDKGQRQAIIVDEIPYQVNKKTLLERIAELVREKKLEGICRHPRRVRQVRHARRHRAEARRSARGRAEQPVQADAAAGHLRHEHGGAGRRPAASCCNLKQLLEIFLEHRREVVTRRTVFELRKARERGHVLEGLAVALANIDEFIATDQGVADAAGREGGADEHELGLVAGARDARARRRRHAGGATRSARRPAAAIRPAGRRPATACPTTRRRRSCRCACSA